VIILEAGNCDRISGDSDQVLHVWKAAILYFEMLKDGQPVNPMDYLAEE